MQPFDDIYNFVISDVCNAYFSGLSFTELWECIKICENRNQLDTAINAQIWLKETVKNENIPH
jgi:hypothetical protein